MVFSTDDRILIENLYKFKGFGPKKLIRDFSDELWNVGSLNKPLKKLRGTGSMRRRMRSSWPRSGHSDKNIDTVNDLVLSQEDAPRSRHATRQIARDSGIHRSPYHTPRPWAKMPEKTLRSAAAWSKLCSMLKSCKDTAASIFGVSRWLYILLRWEDFYHGISSKPPKWLALCEPDDKEVRGWCWTTSAHEVNLQQVVNGVCSGVKAGMPELPGVCGVCGAGHQSQWQMLLECDVVKAATVGYLQHCRRHICLPTRQRTCTPGSRYRGTFVPGDTPVHCSRPVAPK